MTVSVPGWGACTICLCWQDGEAYLCQSGALWFLMVPVVLHILWSLIYVRAGFFQKPGMALHSGLNFPSMPSASPSMPCSWVSELLALDCVFKNKLLVFESLIAPNFHHSHNNIVGQGLQMLRMRRLPLDTPSSRPTIGDIGVKQVRWHRVHGDVTGNICQ